MKKLLPSLVAVKKITSSVPRESFSELKLEQLGKLSLEASGLINPIVLRRTSMQSYEVVDGHFEYYAAVKAKELEPMKGEMIPAFLLEPENEEVLLEQVKLLRQVGNQAVIPLNPPAEPAVNPIPVLSKPEGDRQPIDPTLELTPLTEEIKQLKSVIQTLESNLNSRVDGLTRKIERLQEKDPILAIEALLQQQFKGLQQELKIGKAKTSAKRSVSENTKNSGPTVKQLRDIAKNMGLKGITKMNKGELINIIEQAKTQSSHP
ncbi:Rho termination factor N-terminal domain-containing protein [Laspinema sp. A4]|uniref:Rho termination factor N-terminal domain-containing protein n=1 Tax=Laspinema sp. D2d TaxID=2953686 RepID=UPI0021BAC7A2|nr:Rho termination factor N-terminal domain-containing protein [Laspinema sp. D2d]MCT7981797.1 Rho termination factor N-terminal domain-containing protein [Laspinema sp. D2d]